MNSIVVANWKMNPNSWREAKKLFEMTRTAAESARGVSLVIAPPSIYLREVIKLYKGRRISFAAQNAHFQTSGPYTGEMSMTQIKDARASYVILGHSERRAAGETNEDMRKKVPAALQASLIPIFCVGEQKRSVSGEHFLFVREQLRVGLADVLPGKISQVIIGYEPVWAIGGEKSMSPHDMHEMTIFIRKTIVEMHGEKAMHVKILYGGSVNETNAATMQNEGTVAGFIVGHVSVEPYRFKALLESL